MVAEAEAPILWPPDVKNWLIWKDPVAGKDWRQEEKGMTENEMVGWHHLFDGHEFEQALGVDDGHGSLACWNSWGHKESVSIERLNWTEGPHGQASISKSSCRKCNHRKAMWSKDIRKMQTHQCPKAKVHLFRDIHYITCCYRMEYLFEGGICGQRNLEFFTATF